MIDNIHKVLSKWQSSIKSRLPFFDKKPVRRSYPPEAVNTYMLSFPKCGRTWLRLLLGKIFVSHYHLDYEDLFRLDQISFLHPDIPLVKATHEGCDRVKHPKELAADKNHYADHKVILLVRDFRDTIVSYYFQYTKRESRNEVGSISEFIRRENGPLDILIRYYATWMDNQGTPKDFLLVRYEDMKEDTEGELIRILKFLDMDHIPTSVIREAIEYSRFDNMKNLEAKNAMKTSRLAPGNINDPESFKVRRGVVHGFYDYLDAEDIEYINKKISAIAPFYGYAL